MPNESEFVENSVSSDANPERRRIDKATAANHGEFPDDEAAEEMLPPRGVHDPSSPSVSEREAHQLAGHAVYRSWCRHCIRGRCRAWGHKKSADASQDRRIPVISFDYCYLCQKGDTPEEEAAAEKAGSHPVLVMWDSHTKAPYAWLLPAKGVDFDMAEVAIGQIAEVLKELGYQRVIVRSDGEASLLALIRSVVHRWGGEVVPEHSPPSDPQSNGAAEMAVGVVKGHVRSLKDSLDFKIGSPLPSNHPLLT